MNIGSNKERSDGAFTGLLSPGPWTQPVGLGGRVVQLLRDFEESETHRSSVASKIDLLYGSRLPRMCELRAERGGRSKKHCDQDEKSLSK